MIAGEKEKQDIGFSSVAFQEHLQCHMWYHGLWGFNYRLDGKVLQTKVYETMLFLPLK